MSKATFAGSPSPEELGLEIDDIWSGELYYCNGAVFIRNDKGHWVGMHLEDMERIVETLKEDGINGIMADTVKEFDN